MFNKIILTCMLALPFVLTADDHKMHDKAKKEMMEKKRMEMMMQRKLYMRKLMKERRWKARENTNEKKQQRDLMIKGKRPDGCSYCWKLEDNGQMSDRFYSSGEPWAMDHYKNILDNLLYNRLFCVLYVVDI